MQKVIHQSPNVFYSSGYSPKILTPEENKQQIKKIDFTNKKQVYFNIEYFYWGSRGNLVVNCRELLTDELFFFSVFHDKNYMSKSGDFNFKKFKDDDFFIDDDEEATDEFVGVFEVLSSGFLLCLNARPAHDGEFDKILEQHKNKN